MVNPFQVIMSRVCQNIPKPILQVALKKYNDENHTAYTITSFVQEVFLTRIILPEMNLTGGLLKTIPLRTEWIEHTPGDHAGYAGDDGPYSLFRVPPEARDNKPISCIVSIQYPYNTYLGGGVNSSDIGLGGYCLVDQVDEVLNSYTLARPRNHPTARLLSGDLIRISPSQYSVQNWLMTCRIDFDSSFNNLHHNAVIPLAKATVLAIKHWCHTNLLIDIDRAWMETGQDIGVFKSTIEGWADAKDQYEEAMVELHGSQFMDPQYWKELLFLEI